MVHESILDIVDSLSRCLLVHGSLLALLSVAFTLFQSFTEEVRAM